MSFVIHAVANTGGNNYFEIIGDQTDVFAAGQYFQIRNSVATANNIIYNIATVSLVNGYTRLTPTTAIPVASTSGNLNGGIYDIPFTDATLPGKTNIVIPPATFDSSATSLTLPSRGSYDYGERLVTNIVHSLENFASGTAPIQPTIGQQWYDYTNRTMKVFVDDRWSSDANVNAGVLTFNDPQNANSKMVITANEPTGKEGTGLTVYPAADVAGSSPIFRVLAFDGTAALSVTRSNAVQTNLRFVARSAATSEFDGKIMVAAPTKSFSVGSVLNVNGNIDVVGKIILDESATQHGMIYRTSGSNITATDKLWQVYSAHADAISLSNSSREVARFGTTNTINTPTTSHSTLTVDLLTTLSDVTVTGTASVNVLNVTTATATNLNVPQALTATATGVTLQGTFSANGHVVTDLPAPANPSDAVTKKYQDDLHYLSKLTDVGTIGATNQQALTYNSTSSTWVNTTLTPDYVSGIDNRIRDTASSSILAGTNVGITPTYNNGTRVLSLAVNQQTVNATGDATGSAILDWSGTLNLPLTLKASGVTAGIWPKVSVNSKGIVVSGSALAATDIPALDASKITTGTLTVNTSGNAATATQLATGVYINGTYFDGTEDVYVSDSQRLYTGGGTLTGKVLGTFIGMKGYLSNYIRAVVEGTVNLDFSSACTYLLTLSNPTTFAVSGMPTIVVGTEMVSVTIQITQPSVVKTLNWGLNINWLTPNGAVPTQTAGKTTEYHLTCIVQDGSSWTGRVVASN